MSDSFFNRAFPDYIGVLTSKPQTLRAALTTMRVSNFATKYPDGIMRVSARMKLEELQELNSRIGGGELNRKGLN